MSQFQVKLVFGDEMRRIWLSEPPSWKSLRQAARKNFRLRGRSTYRLVYEDDEGDRVTLFDDASFVEAVKAGASGKLLKITVVQINQASASLPPPRSKDKSKSKGKGKGKTSTKAVGGAGASKHVEEDDTTSSSEETGDDSASIVSSTSGSTGSESEEMPTLSSIGPVPKAAPKAAAKPIRSASATPSLRGERSCTVVAPSPLHLLTRAVAAGDFLTIGHDVKADKPNILPETLAAAVAGKTTGKGNGSPITAVFTVTGTTSAAETTDDESSDSEGEGQEGEEDEDEEWMPDLVAVGRPIIPVATTKATTLTAMRLGLARCLGSAGASAFMDGHSEVAFLSPTSSEVAWPSSTALATMQLTGTRTSTGPAAPAPTPASSPSTGTAPALPEPQSQAAPATSSPAPVPVPVPTPIQVLSSLATTVPAAVAAVEGAIKHNTQAAATKLMGQISEGMEAALPGWLKTAVASASGTTPTSAGGATTTTPTATAAPAHPAQKESSPAASSDAPQAAPTTLPVPPIVHSTVQCDACGAAPLTGIRYKCAACPDFDLCAQCEAMHTAAAAAQFAGVGGGVGVLHDISHPFLKILSPAQNPALLVTVLSEDHEVEAARAMASAAAGQAAAGGDAASVLQAAFDAAVSETSTGTGTGTGAPQPSPQGHGLHLHHHHHGHHGHHGRRGIRGGWHHNRRFCAEDASADETTTGTGTGSCVLKSWRDRMAERRAGEGHVHRGGWRGGCGHGGWRARMAQAQAAAQAAAGIATADQAAGAVAPSSPLTGAVTEETTGSASTGTGTGRDEEERLLEIAIRESLSELASQVAATNTATAAPSPAAPPKAVDASLPSIPLPQASFIAHLTYTDKASAAPGTRLVKAWRMRNDGPTPWPAGTQLAFVGGDQMGAPNAVPVHQVVPGATVDIAVPLQAPKAAGRYQSYWRLVYPAPQAAGTTSAAPGGGAGTGSEVAVGPSMCRFGHRVWADVFVECSPITTGTGTGEALATAMAPLALGTAALEEATSTVASASAVTTGGVPLHRIPMPANYNPLPTAPAPEAPTATTVATGTSTDSLSIEAQINAQMDAVLQSMTAGARTHLATTPTPVLAEADAAPASPKLKARAGCAGVSERKEGEEHVLEEEDEALAAALRMSSAPAPAPAPAPSPADREAQALVASAAASAAAAGVNVSAGGVLVTDERILQAAQGNTNAAAVLAALAAASPTLTASPAPVSTGASPVLAATPAPAPTTAKPTISASPSPSTTTSPLLRAAVATAAATHAPHPAPAAITSPAVSIAGLPERRWSFHVESLAGMGFVDEDKCVELLDRYDGNLQRVVNSLLEGTD